MEITQARSAKTLTPSHMKQCILSESRFDFLKDLVKNIPDASVQEDNANNALFEASVKLEEENDMEDQNMDGNEDRVESNPQTSDSEDKGSSSRTPVIQYAPNVTSTGSAKVSFSVTSLLKPDKPEPNLHIEIESEKVPVQPENHLQLPISNTIPTKVPSDGVPPLIPIAHNFYNASASGNLCIDEDYDN